MHSSSSRPPFSTTKFALGVSDLVAQHDESVYQQVTRDRHLCPGLLSAMQHPVIELLHLCIFARCFAAGLDEQEPQDSRPSLRKLGECPIACDGAESGLALGSPAGAQQPLWSRMECMPHPRRRGVRRVFSPPPSLLIRPIRFLSPEEDSRGSSPT